MVNGEAGKGSKYRPVDQKKYEENWKRAFNKKGKKINGKKKENGKEERN